MSKREKYGKKESLIETLARGSIGLLLVLILAIIVAHNVNKPTDTGHTTAPESPGISSPSSSQNESPERTNAVRAVQRTMTEVSQLGRTYLAGPLEGGIAVLVDNLAAYWVKDGQVYAANGFAMTWSPNIPVCRDPDINFDSVKQAVK